MLKTLPSKLLVPYLVVLLLLCVSLLYLTLSWKPSEYVSYHRTLNVNNIDIHMPEVGEIPKPNVTQGPPKPATILLYHGLHGSPNWWFKMTDADFAHCPQKCQVINDRKRIKDADMLLFEAPRLVKKQVNNTIYLEYFRDWGEWPSQRGHTNQVRMFFAREPQTAGLNGDGLSFARHMFNYTTTFQRDADIFYPYGHSEKLATPKNITLPDYGKQKPDKVLWIVSNCYSRKRMDYKEELHKYIQVDIVGKCNTTHGDPCNRDYRCTAAMKARYKFYLAFENSLCQEYITEKFWKALNEGMVPIAMGAPKKAYERVAPPHSFIHVDDFVSPQKLAEYLHVLDKNSTLYNEYHQWRRTHVIRWESANCGLCKFATEKPRQIRDITESWNARTQCVWP